MRTSFISFLARGLVLGTLAVAMLAPKAAHADYGGQAPITKWGVFAALEAKGILTQEPQVMEEAFHHGHLSSNPDDKCIQAVFEATNTARGDRNPDERMAQSAGHATISGTPAYLVQEAPWTGRKDHKP